ncbi:MAG: NlpC/P60 family protein [Actinomycetota bacterium]|nr:NlpC/P60 family protein [Actinomycetota bacterium]
MSPPLLAARAARRLRRRAKPAGIAAGVVALMVIAAITSALGALPRMEQVVADQQVGGATADIPPTYLAAYQRAASSVQPAIPWEILAGIGKVATDHGRRSPYDGTDRASAPNADYPDVSPPIVAHPPDPPTPPGAGPAAPQTLAAVAPAGAPDSELATDVNNVPVFLAGERQVESGGNYQASSAGASGAYQYINATWASDARAAGYPQYATGPAAGAPPHVQDDVAAFDAERLFATFHNWWWAAEAWYDPLWAGDPAEQSSVPYPSAGNTVTMAGYAQKVYAAMAASIGTGTAAELALTAGTAPSPPSGTAVSGSGPLLLTSAGTAPAPGADEQDIDTEADLLARSGALVEERTWEQMGLPSSIVDRPLSDPDAQRFWSSVLAALPTANGVGIGPVSTGGGAPSAAAAAPPSSSTPGAGSPMAGGLAAGADPMGRFATDLLTNLAVPVTPTNVAAIRAWASGEGSSARFNPLDTTQQEPGAAPYNANGGDPVENYPDYRTGIAATVATLEPGGHPSLLYGGILAALQAGSSAQAVEGAVAASPWGTQHFPNPNFPAAANFPGPVPAGHEPVTVADRADPSPTGAGPSGPAGPDAHPAADALTMAQFYAGVISDPRPAAGSSYAPSPTTTAGYQIPAGTPPAVVRAINVALAQLGKPYGWGAAGPDRYDCSGLVMAAYGAAGITLPRTTYAQYLVGQPVPLGDPNQFRPGDLVFMMGSDPQGAAPGHVGMFLGAGQVIDAPYTGAVIRISPLGSWTPKLVSVRRMVPV